MQRQIRCARDLLGEVLLKDNGDKAGVEGERLQTAMQV